MSSKYTFDNMLVSTNAPWKSLRADRSIPKRDAKASREFCRDGNFFLANFNVSIKSKLERSSLFAFCNSQFRNFRSNTERLLAGGYSYSCSARTKELILKGGFWSYHAVETCDLVHWCGLRLLLMLVMVLIA